jgi:hypothetical protein
MEFPQKEEEGGEEEEEGEELRSVLVRVYSSHIHENRKADSVERYRLIESNAKCRYLNKFDL